MYPLYNQLPQENRDAWRNAYEIKLAAIQHEKRRQQAVDDAGLPRPQVIRKGRQSAWAGLVSAPLRLLALLIG